MSVSTTAGDVYERFLTAATAALAPAAVYDVAPAQGTAEQLYLVVEGVTKGHQDWGSLGGSAALARRDESYDLTMEIVAWSGGSDFPALRAQAFGLLDSLVTLMLTSPQVGLPPLAGFQHLTDLEMQLARTPQGVAVRLPFTVSVLAHNVR